MDEIRVDILKWILKLGHIKLRFPAGIDANIYAEKMKEILAPKKVSISFTEKEISVFGKEKTCRNYISENQAFMECNIKRFKETSEANQYRLIHHEYAGLAMLEKNEEAASDYFISNQITGFLVPETVLRLSVREDEGTETYVTSCNAESMMPFTKKRSWIELKKD